MANLTGQKPRDTYKQLLNLSDSISSTYQTLTDGLGNSAGIEIKTGNVNIIDGTSFYVNGVPVGASTLSGLGDVELTSATSGDLLRYNGTDWVNITQATLKSSLSLNNVENTALSTWAGSTNLNTLSGSITINTSGTFNSTAVTANLLPTGSTGQRPTGTLGMIRYNTSDGRIEAFNGTSWDQAAISSGSGETNTASSVGTGQSLYKTKTGVNLDFYSIKAASNKITIALSTDDITVDVAESNLALANISGTLAINKGGTGQTAKTAAFDALSPTTTKGDLLVSDGTNNIRLAVGTNTHVLTADSAQASGVKWAAVTGVAVTTKGDIQTYSTTSDRLAVGTDGYCLIADSGASTGLAWAQRARLLQVVTATFATNTSGTSTIPNDDTIPQNTEGTELFTMAVTPKSASSTLYLQLVGCATGNSAQNNIYGIWKDSTANALACFYAYCSASGGQNATAINYSEASSSTTLRTYKVRIGAVSGTWGVNGTVSGRLLGGSQAWTLTCWEVL